MPRLVRLDAPGVVHHVMGRGIERREIFVHDIDRLDFIYRLADLAENAAWDVYAWVLVPNHFHLLVKSQGRSLSENMRTFLTGYAVNFNRRHRRSGHLFQNRYKSIVCQEDLYLKELVRYIHLNLFRAGIVKTIDELNRSPWSGHSALMGKVKLVWQDTDYVLAYFGNRRSCRRNYLNFVKEGVDQGQRMELVGGGLVRSLGGWSEVRAMRKRGEKVSFDQRILGDSDFIEKVRSGTDEFIKGNLGLSGQRIGIDRLAEEVCEKFNILKGELCSGSRRGGVVRARRELSWRAVREIGYSGAEVARYLGVSNSCVTRVVAFGEKERAGDGAKNL